MATGRAALDRLVVDLGGVPRALQGEMRESLTRAAQPILMDARKRASWSTRIPQAITLKASVSQRAPGVRMVADSQQAPHARPWEFGSGRNRNLRFRLFGTNVWFEKEPRSFFFPAVRAGQAGVMEEINKSIDEVARRAGFR